MFRDLLTNDINTATVELFSVPLDCNSSISFGSADAPNVLKELSEHLPPYDMLGNRLDHVKIFVHENFKENTIEELMVTQINFFQSNKFKLIFGGDHSTSIPFQNAFIKSCTSSGHKPVIIHIDAHCDLCDVYKGNKYSHACTNRRALDNGLLPQNLFMIGIREFEKDGIDTVSNLKINCYTSIEVLEDGIKRFTDDLNKCFDNKTKIYLSFDIDSLDSAYAPGTGTPETCGLTPLIVRKILKTVAATGLVACMDIVEVSPQNDVNNVTSFTALKLLYEFFSELKLV